MSYVNDWQWLDTVKLDRGYSTTSPCGRWGTRVECWREGYVIEIWDGPVEADDFTKEQLWTLYQDESGYWEMGGPCCLWQEGGTTIPTKQIKQARAATPCETISQYLELREALLRQGGVGRQIDYYGVRWHWNEGWCLSVVARVYQTPTGWAWAVPGKEGHERYGVVALILAAEAAQEELARFYP